MAILEHLSIVSPNSLKKLIINVDLMTEEHRYNKTRTYTCARLISKFKNLVFLSLHFTAQIELQEKIRSLSTSQENIQKNFIAFLLQKMPQLKQLVSCNIRVLSARGRRL